MASPFDCSFSFVLSDLNNSNDSDDEDFDETDNYNERDDDNPSEMSVAEELDASIVESDYEDYSYEIPGDGDSVIYEGVHENDGSDNSFEADFDNHLEEDSTRGTEPTRRNLEKGDHSDEETVDQSQKCPICLGAWTTTGKHRLCSLRCGHIFGYSCIEQWLKSNNEYAERCPQCNAKASLKHIRFLYANKVISLDSTELENMQKQIKKCNKKYNQMKKALAKEKKRARKYKEMYKSQKSALTDSDFGLSD